ncbi:MAG: hypothetical protein ACRDJ9_36475 [Dehalococcoidia bacterium]
MPPAVADFKPDAEEPVVSSVLGYRVHAPATIGSGHKFGVIDLDNHHGTIRHLLCPSYVRGLAHELTKLAAALDGAPAVAPPALLGLRPRRNGANGYDKALLSIEYAGEGRGASGERPSRIVEFTPSRLPIAACAEPAPARRRHKIASDEAVADAWQRYCTSDATLESLAAELGITGQGLHARFVSAHGRDLVLRIGRIHRACGGGHTPEQRCAVIRDRVAEALSARPPLRKPNGRIL